jgi:hypothetical protein
VQVFDNISQFEISNIKTLNATLPSNKIIMKKDNMTSIEALSEHKSMEAAANDFNLVDSP